MNNTADSTTGQDRPPKPSALPVIPEQIPPELKERPQWVFWRWTWIEKRQKWDKPPFQSRGGNLADPSSPKTWSGFQTALNAYHYEESNANGIGYMFVKKNEEVGGDLDGCRDPETGTIAPWAQALIDAFKTYTEISTSGTGVHFIAKGQLPGRGLHVGKIEMYDNGRYFCTTGHHLPGTPLTIEPRQEAITQLYRKLRDQQAGGKRHADPSQNGTAPSPTLDDDTIIQKALGARNGEKFSWLWAGDIERWAADRLAHADHPETIDTSHSGADLALFRELVYWTEDRQQLDRLLRRSGLIRDKWDDHPTYADDTITKAIETPHNRYQGVSADRNGQPSDERNASSNSDKQESGPPLTLVEVVVVFRRWLHMPHLIGALYVLLGTYAANRMLGDPLWLMLVGGSGWGKTELLMSIIRLPHVHMASTLTEASLLSGTSRREKGKDSTGGILRKIGEFGYLLCKDFTSILSMNRESSTAMLAALREIFDGEWTRHVGVDGGRTLGWKGKVAVIAGCTGAIDRFHAVVGALGERFVSFRLKDLDATLQGTQALQLVGQEAAMRKELSGAVSGLFSGVTLPEKAIPLDQEETTSLVALASLAALCRSPVIRDHTGEIELILDQEAPSRLVMSLSRLYTGMQAIGVSKAEARPLIHKVALDCMSALRRDVFDRLIDNEDRWKTQELATTLGYPYNTTKRTLEDLTAHGVACRHRQGKADEWNISDAAFQLFQVAKEVFPPEITEDCE